MFRRLVLALSAAIILAGGGMSARADEVPVQPVMPTAAQSAEIAQMQAVVDSLKPQTGAIDLPQAHTSLNLGDAYYYLDAADSRRVLVDLWGNPPGNADGVLGMVFPTGKSPMDDTWGAVISYSADGYVSDAEATGYDYDALLNRLRDGEAANNRERQKNGYAEIELAGWAQAPTYDPDRHALIWAKDLTFSDADIHTLNYDVRVLGRRGVLSMNIVSVMPDLANVSEAANGLMQTASFAPGSRYTDFVEGVDRKAEFGLAGLVAGGAAVLVAKKVGLIGILLLVLKKGAVIILAGLAGIGTWVRRMFGGKAGGEFSTPGTGIAPKAALEADPGLMPVAQPLDDDPDRPREL
tara:strand:+ start:512 stop:1567 length:1056 start_codon:yes stop_codon:yes gene_type:complete